MRSALALSLLLAACTIGAPETTPPPPPSEAAARAHLQAVVDVVRAGDIDAVCGMGSGTCRKQLRESDPAAVPSQSPVVVGTRVILPSRVTGGWNHGGRVLELCGRDGLGRPYTSEMLVFEMGGRLISIGTLFWLGVRIASDAEVEAVPSRPGPCPAFDASPVP